MIVKDLVETRELMIEEMKENVVVVYERFDNIDCQCEGNNVEQVECDPEEVVQILVGCTEDSLKNYKTFYVGEDFTSVEEIIENIRENYSDLLKI